MNFRKLLLAGAATAVGSATFATSTQASIIDRPHFKVEPIIIVWATDGVTGTAPYVTDFYVGSEANDLIAADGHAVQTGSLNAAADAIGTIDSLIDIDGPDGSAALGLNPATATTGALSAFSVDSMSLTGSSATATWNSSFYVASNTPFNIEATATALVEDGFELSDIGYSLAIISSGDTDGSVTWGGGNSQDPLGSIISAIATLNDLQTTTDVYTIGTDGRRTAAGSGTIAQQSVRFDATYTFEPDGGVYDLSDGDGEIQAEVTYTFYVA